MNQDKMKLFLIYVGLFCVMQYQLASGFRVRIRVKRRRRRRTPAPSPRDCVPGDWSEWSTCSQQCGNAGSQTRSRGKKVTECCGGGCPYIFSEVRSCNRDACKNGGTPTHARCHCTAGWTGTCCETGPLNMTVCPSPITVNESTNVTCMCKAERGNSTELLSVAWYDQDGKQIDGMGKGMKELNLNNVNRTQAGTYTCQVDSNGLKEEKSIKVNVNFPPRETKLTLTPASVECSKTVTIQCAAEGYPQPTYEIWHEKRIVNTGRTYIIKLDGTHIGLYTCITKNLLGSHSVRRNFTIQVEKTSTTRPPTFNTSEKKKAASSSKVWHIVIALLAGIVFGILLSHLALCSRRQFRKRKPPSKPEQQITPNDNSTYQDLDITKMNSEDNYEPLRGNHAKNEHS